MSKRNAPCTCESSVPGLFMRCKQCAHKPRYDEGKMPDFLPVIQKAATDLFDSLYALCSATHAAALQNGGADGDPPEGAVLDRAEFERRVEEIRKGIAVDVVSSMEADFGALCKRKRTVAMAETRGHVVRELVESEKDYLKDLEVVNSVWRPPIEKSAWLDDEKKHAMFMCMDGFVTVSKSVCEKLERECALEAKEQRFGKVFLELEREFDVFDVYCREYEKIQEGIDGLNAAEAFVKFQKDTCRKRSELKGVDLEGFLIKPVQRITKYPLLLSDLLKNTPPGMEDCADLEKAIAKLKGMVGKINDSVRRVKDRAIVEEIDRELIWTSFPKYDLLKSKVIVYHHDSVQWKLRDDYSGAVYQCGDYVYVMSQVVLCCETTRLFRRELATRETKNMSFLEEVYKEDGTVELRYSIRHPENKSDTLILSFTNRLTATTMRNMFAKCLDESKTIQRPIKRKYTLLQSATPMKVAASEGDGLNRMVMSERRLRDKRVDTLSRSALHMTTPLKARSASPMTRQQRKPQPPPAPKF